MKTWISQCRKLIEMLKFSALDEEKKVYVEREIFYFNDRRFLVIPWAIMAVELFNMINVAFFSKSGLGTVHNFRYFAMYLFLFAGGPVCLAIRWYYRGKKKILGRYYVGFTMVWLLWNAVISAMDLQRHSNITAFVIGIFATSFLMRLKPVQTLCMMPGSLTLLLLLAGDRMTNGVAVNGSIATLVAVLMSCSRYVVMLEELDYRQKMIRQENRRTRERYRAAFLKEQQKALLECSGEILFIWDAEEDRLLLAGDRRLREKDREALLSWLAGCREESREIMLLGLTGGRPGRCRVTCVPQHDENGRCIGAAGRIEPEEETENYQK